MSGNGIRWSRRGYSFTDGIDPQAGTLLGGLCFIAFMKHPAQFIQLQRSLAADALNEYIHHTGSGVFACPPGLRPGQDWATPSSPEPRSRGTPPRSPARSAASVRVPERGPGG